MSRPPGLASVKQESCGLDHEHTSTQRWRIERLYLVREAKRRMWQCTSDAESVINPGRRELGQAVESLGGWLRTTIARSADPEALV